MDDDQFSVQLLGIQFCFFLPVTDSLYIVTLIAFQLFDLAFRKVKGTETSERRNLSRQGVVLGVKKLNSLGECHF